jgi:hypothetical protein
MATIKFFLPFLLLLCVTTATLSAQNQNKSKVWIVVSYVKEDAKADYEKWITDIFLEPMKTSQDTILKKQFDATRWLTPARQNKDKTWTFVFLMDPVVPKGDYDIEHFLVKTYGEAKGKNYFKQYEGFMASAAQVHVLNR